MEGPRGHGSHRSQIRVAPPGTFHAVALLLCVGLATWWSMSSGSADGGKTEELERSLPNEECAVPEDRRFDFWVGEGDAKTERFRIRSYVPQEERWVRYTVRPTSPALVRWEGSGEDPYTLTRATDVQGEPATRVVYREIASDSFVRELRAPSDDPSGWTTVSRTRLRSR